MHAARLSDPVHKRTQLIAEYAQAVTEPALARLSCSSQPALIEPQLADMLQRFRQPQVRYRPGFSRYWRQHRRTFAQQF